MATTYEGQEYEFIIGSDVGSNSTSGGMYLEARALINGSPEVVLFAFLSDTGDNFTFSAYKEDLPFPLVEEFVQVAREQLWAIDQE